jgi:hypothetical protein
VGDGCEDNELGEALATDKAEGGALRGIPEGGGLVRVVFHEGLPPVRSGRLVRAAPRYTKIPSPNSQCKEEGVGH